MARLAIAGALLLLCAGCGSVIEPEGGTGPEADPNLEGAPEEVRRGADLFAAHCQSCHGPNAGGGLYPGSLVGRSGILGQVRSGGGGMPPFPPSQLSDADVAAIEAWLAWLATTGGGGGGGGGEIHPFARHCAGCHGATGEGTDRAPQIRSPHEGYATWVVRNGRDTMGYPAPMPRFDEATLDADTLDEIFIFLHEQPRPRDGRGLYLRFCGNCHGPDGRGGVVGENARDEAEDRDDFFEVVREGEGGNRYGARRDYMPGRSRAELPDTEVEKIRRFLLSSGDGDDDVDLVFGCSAGGGGGLPIAAALLLVARCLRPVRRRP